MTKTRIIPKLRRALSAMAVAAATLVQSGCESLVYDGTDCTGSYNLVKLTYDRNMKFADAFDAEVERVSLLAFRAGDGTLARRIDVEAADLSADNEVVLDVEPGDYDILVWAGRYDETFDIAQGMPSGATLSDFHCRMKRSAAGEVASDLARLYHGLQRISCPYASPSHPNRVELKLTKDTNSVRVLLQQVSGEPLDVSNFKFEITDANGWLNADNSLRADNIITYRPWDLFSGTVDVNTDPTDAPTNPADAPALKAPTAASRAGVSAALAEFTVGRLMSGAEPRLRITNAESGEEVLNININEYAMLVRGFYNRHMSEQEYLDRQDEYNMTFFLKENNEWLSTVIIINDWRIVRNVGALE